MLKIKRKHILLVALLSILVVIIAFAGAHFAFKPLDYSVTINGLQVAAEETDYILVKTDDSYFEIQGTTAFSNLFEFDQWQQQNEAPSERRCLCSDLLKHGLLSFMRTEQ